MTTTWTDMLRSIQDTGRIDPLIVRSLATMRADHEMRAWRDAGFPRPWAKHYREAIEMVMLRAKTILDNEMAARERAKLPADEQLARTALLNAELAERAIPPRPEEARRWREEAANVRRSKFRVVGQ